MNDYNIPVASLSVPFDEIRTFVPHVIQAIGEGIKVIVYLFFFLNIIFINRVSFML